MSETTEKDVQVQDNGEKAENHGPTTMTMEEMAAAIETDPKLREELLASDDEQFFKEHPVEKAEDSQPEDHKSEEDKKEDDLPDEVQVTVKRDWLGTYAKNREPDEAVREMSKGNAEKDKTIDFFKKEKLPQLEGEIAKSKETEASLKKEIEEYKKRLEKPEKTETIPEVPALDLDDEDLFLTDEGQAKFKKSYAQMAEAIKALSQKVTEKPAEVKPEVKEESPADAPQDAVRREYAEIDNFVSSKHDVFGAAQPIELLENEFLDFMGNLAKVANFDGPIQQEDGQFTDAAKAALKTYLDTDNESSKAVRKAMQDNKLPLLDEAKYDTLTSIYKVRNIKNEYNVPYDVALEIHQARTRPSEADLKLQGNVEGHKQFAKAKANREQFVKTAPTDATGGDAEIFKMPLQEFQAVLAKPKDKWTDRERHIVKTVYKQKGISDEEIKQSFGI